MVSSQISKSSEKLFMPTQLLAIVKDGKIQTLDSINLPEGTELIVTIMPVATTLTDRDLASSEWSNLSLHGLNRAYADDEPEYEISQLKELNSSYERM
jgi:hypothetical protein